MSITAHELVEQARARIEAVTPQQAFEELSTGKAVALDIREPSEWEEHIDGAVQVPRGLLEFAADPTSARHHDALDPSARVIVYCRSGTRAALAALTLQTLGFTHVANLEGGFVAWKEAGLPWIEHHADL
ncbi:MULTISPECIES: rhodanese-like domain-containing protein [unclassified Synechococcus]|uniref:rhodanese-like domain-containing protein n=1 Tax=unclassified Synechococcus TaxID=2626047 RepID=UPI00055DBA11|nr:MULTISPECIES: rhodanese-like domain-containing protein [unclassified Synechococcus]WFN59679.1 rhodanese-like domain-containing protein [Synechococcus sp. CCFWC 502]CAK6696918.1 putative adenylyltransferase/sulfurtransferase MoeZ [Synechococcus sp. CBW1107]